MAQITENQIALLRQRLETILKEHGGLREGASGFQIEAIEPYPYLNPELNTFKIHWSAEVYPAGSTRCELRTGWEIVKFRAPADVIEDLEIIP